MQLANVLVASNGSQLDTLRGDYSEMDALINSFQINLLVFSDYLKLDQDVYLLNIS